MRGSLARIARLASLIALLFALPSPPSRCETSASCAADVTSSYRTEEVFDNRKDKIFVVQISTPAPCAMVSFDLVTTERLFNGEEIAMTSTNSRKITAGAESTFKVRFAMAKDSELVDWKIQYRSCTACGN